MKRISTVLVLLSAALILTACAGTAPPREAPTEINHSYVNTIENHTSRMGVRVFWVNPPRQKTGVEEDS